MRVGAQVKTAFFLFESLALAPSWGWRNLGFSGQGAIQAGSVSCLLPTSCSDYGHAAASSVSTSRACGFIR